jgi:integrase
MPLSGGGVHPIAYINERRHRWSERHFIDHLKMAAEGGQPRKRLPGVRTQPGPLRALLIRPLSRIDAEAVEDWLARNKERPARAALGFRLLAVFLGWIAEHPDYRDLAHVDACKARRTREQVAKPARKDDVLQREQLRAWFAEVRKLNPVPAAYLQTLLLTGARREELAQLRWEDVDFAWRSLRIGDKVEGSRVIPLTDYVAALLLDLKNRDGRPPIARVLRRRNASEGERITGEHQPSPWVFCSKTSASGRLVEPRIPHNQALDAAGLPPLTLHGLRRSFGTLAEWVEAPVGVVAQIMGHQPSAIAEKHYRRRPLDLLRQWHQRIEVWVLCEAGIEMPKAALAAPALALAQGGRGEADDLAPGLGRPA